MANVRFLRGRRKKAEEKRQKAEGRSKKLTKHEVPGGAAPLGFKTQRRTALDFSAPAINNFGENWRRGLLRNEGMKELKMKE